MINMILLLKIFNTFARSYKINWRTETTKTCGAIYFCKDLEISIFLTLSYFWAFTLVSIKKIVSFTFLQYFNLNVEYKGVLSIFLFLLEWSRSIPYLTILAALPPFSKFLDPPLALFLKQNHPKKYQVTKRFFIRNKFFYKLVYVNSVSFNYKRLSG